MTEQCVVRYPSPQAALKGDHIIYPLANVAPFAKEILIHIGYRQCVEVQTGIPGKHVGEQRPAGAGRFNIHPRLQHSVSGHDLTAVWIQLGPVQRVRQGRNQASGGATGNSSICVHGDHISDPGQHFQLSDLDPIGGILASTEQAIELDQLASLALPPHPAILSWVPLAVAMEEIERPAASPSVLSIQGHDAVLKLHQQFAIIGHLLFGRISEIREQRQAQVRVLVAQEVKLQASQ